MKRAPERAAPEKSGASSNQVLDTLPAMLASWGRDQRNRASDRAFAAWFGLTPEQLKGRHLRDVLGEERYRASERFALAALNGESHIFDVAAVDPPGDQRHFQVSYVPDLQDGEVKGFFIVGSDITSRKNAEEALTRANEDLDLRVAERTRDLAALNANLLREIEQRKGAEHAQTISYSMFSALFAAAPASLLVGSDGIVEIANADAERLFEYGQDQLIGVSIEQLFPDWVQLGCDVRMRSFVEQQGLDALRRDGGAMTVAVTLSPFFFDGRSSSLVVVRDLTEQRNLERAVREAEDRSRQAQKLEAIGTLAGGIAHDFNNMLSVILSYAQVCIDSLPAGDPLREDIVEIKSAGQRAAEMTAQLLAFSRQQVIQPRIIELNEVIHGMKKMLQRLLGEDVQFEMVQPVSLWKVKADPGQIEQIIMNLAVNARAAMAHGGRLTIEMSNVDFDDVAATARPGTMPRPYVMVAVTDTGCGMDKATLARIFEPFFTTKGTGKGTGLGLATVFGIVQQNGGWIAVDSAPGIGSTFKVYFPRAGEASESIRPGPQQQASVAGTETILLVEDESPVRALIARTLRGSGYTVLDASSPAEALAVSEQHTTPIDLLLTDVVMPGMNGRQLADHLARSRPTMKVIFMSGYTTDVVVHHGVMEGAMSFLQKPITPAIVLRRLREVLDAAAAARG